MSFWLRLHKSAKPIPEGLDDFLALVPEIDKTNPRWHRFDDFFALAPEVHKTVPRNIGLMTFWPWLQKSAKLIPGSSIWWLPGCGSRSRQNQSQEARFGNFVALVPEVDKTNSRMLDLMTSWPWLQKSTKAVPEVSIWWFSGHGFRSWPNRSQKYWFNDFLALVPEVDKIIPGSSIWWLYGFGSGSRQNHAQKPRFNDSLVMEKLDFP